MFSQFNKKVKCMKILNAIKKLLSSIKNVKKNKIQKAMKSNFKIYLWSSKCNVKISKYYFNYYVHFCKN